MTDMHWDAVKAAAELIATFVAVATFVHGVLEYRRKNALERFNKFQEMRERWNSRDFNEITDSSYSLGKVDISIKYNLWRSWRK